MAQLTFPGIWGTIDDIKDAADHLEEAADALRVQLTGREPYRNGRADRLDVNPSPTSVVARELTPEIGTAFGTDLSESRDLPACQTA